MNSEESIQPPAKPAPDLPGGRRGFGSPESGFRLLSSGTEALAARLALIRKTARTLDLQYYIASGRTFELVCESLLEAAQRGVKIRLLLDDLGAWGNDALLAVVHHLPGLEVRLWNPLLARGFRPISQALEFLFHASRLNRRMHNKLFIADNAWGIAGGRNLGDEYFDAPGRLSFHDLDVLATGPVVREMTRSFEAYWHSRSAVPFARVHARRPTPNRLEEARSRLAALRQDITHSDYGEALRNNPLACEMASGTVRWIHADAHFVADDPAKTLAKRLRRKRSLVARLEPLIPEPKKEFLVLSPYFVPGRKGLRSFRRLTKHGVMARVLTNSLAATDAWLVHAGYRHYRKRLLRMGVRLYELRPSPAADPRSTRRTPAGTSMASLHAKSFVIDRETVFIGSLNLDPRSLRLNTEVGLVINSPELASEIVALFERLRSPAYSYRLGVDPATKGVLWTTENGGRECVYHVEPEAGFWLRVAVELVSLLPLESQL